MKNPKGHSRGSVKRGQGSHKHDVGDETLKSNSRPGSVSPSTQKSAHSRTLEPMKGGGRRAGERDSVSVRTTTTTTTTTSHSRGSSITKSLTPNLSPHSTLSASSSSGSLRQEAEYTPPTTTTSTTVTSSAGGGAAGAEPRATTEEEIEESRREGDEGVVEGVAESGLGLENKSSNATLDSSTHAVLEQLEAVHLSKSQNSVVEELQPTAVSHSIVDAIQTVTGAAVDPSIAISSPPGLSKSRSQPLPLSERSEMVCRQLDLGAGGVNPSPVLARSDSMGVGPQAGSRLLGQHLLSRGGGGVQGNTETGAVSNSNNGESIVVCVCACACVCVWSTESDLH